MVKMVAFRLKATAAAWWDQLQNSRQRQGKQRVGTWRKMKSLVMERFLPTDYEQILYRMYLGCAQGNRSNIWTLQEAINMAMKAELLEKEKRQPNFRRNTTKASEYATGASSGSGDKEKANFIKEVDEDDEKDEVGEDHYAGAEFAIEEGMERITLVLQKVLLAPKEEGQRHSIFRSLCLIKNKVCDVIVDNESCENFVSKKLVEHLQLSTEPHVSPYSLGCVKKGPSVRVVETCRVPLSIGRDNVILFSIAMATTMPSKQSVKPKTRSSSFLTLISSEQELNEAVKEAEYFCPLVLKGLLKLGRGESDIPEDVQQILSQFQELISEKLPNELPSCRIYNTKLT
ncbi:hypothetical protein L3X38_018550 [Prunus dulcis]|uniref:Retrotransposon gag domain-containing protein n=1 Tax=Prunus dulcis TaxID=3755 RepID=A0AAD4ZBR1_PRUDU|nr:hypothetical protein L3X38_018550 [Prunus dulcis]